MKSNSQMNMESRQALTLTGVAAIFVLGHSLRFVISPVEFVWTKNNFAIQSDGCTEDLDCQSDCSYLPFPLWILVSAFLTMETIKEQ